MTTTLNSAFEDLQSPISITVNNWEDKTSTVVFVQNDNKISITSKNKQVETFATEFLRIIHGINNAKTPKAGASYAYDCVHLNNQGTIRICNLKGIELKDNGCDNCKPHQKSMAPKKKPQTHQLNQ